MAVDPLLRLGLKVDAAGTQRTIAELLAIQAALKKTADEAPALSRLAQALGTNYKAIRQLAEQAGVSGDQLEQMVNELRQLRAVGADSAVQFARLATQFDITEDQIRTLNRGLDAFEREARQAQAASGGWAGGLGELAFRFNSIVGSLQLLLAAARPAYDFLIGSNERLNAQLLASQTNLASSVRVFQGGQEITDPTARIEASRSALEAALKQIEQDTQSLVGVTSAQVNELFQITLTNAAELNQQSQRFPGPIEAATQLTKGWAASLKVIGVPLDQARQEINSILQGTIDQNSILGKNLGITNQQVAEWKAQRVLVDQLNTRLETFVAGNAIAARSVEGISSNIADLIQRLGREAGQPLLEPIISALADLEAFLKENEAALVEFFRGISEGAIDIASGLGDQFIGVFERLSVLTEDGALLAQNLFTILRNGVTTAFELGSALTEAVFGPTTDALVQIIQLATEGLNKLSQLIFLRQINDAQDAINILSESSDFLSQELNSVSSAIKALNDQQAQGVPLTQEQREEYDRLTQRSQGVVDAIDQQIAAYRSINAVSPEVKANLDANIQGLELLRDAALRTTGSLELQGKGAERLGDSYGQLEKRVADTLRSLDSSSTKGDAVQKAAADLLKLTEQQLQLGQITEEEARQRLDRIAADARVEVDTQIAARQQVVANRRTSIDAEISAISAGQAEIEALQAQGRISEIEADRQLTQLKVEELQKRVEANRAAQQSAGGTALQELVAQERELQAQITQVQAEAVNRQREQAERAAEEQRQTQERAEQERQRARVELERRALAEIERANQQAEQAIALSQFRRIAELRQQQIQTLRQQGVDAVAINQQTEEQIRRVQNDGLNQRIAAEQAALERIRLARAQGRISQEQAAQQEASTIQAIAQLNQQRLEAELTAIENARQARIQAIEQEIDRTRQAADVRLGVLRLESEALQQQESLLSAQSNLQQSLNRLRSQRLQFALEDAQAEGNLVAVKQLQRQIQQQESAELRQQYEFRLQSLEISRRQQEIELNIARINAEIAELEAEAALRKAEAEGAERRTLEILRQQLELRRQQVELAGQAIDQQAAIDEAAQQQAQVEFQAESEALQRQQQQERESLQGLGEAATRAAQSLGQVSESGGDASQAVSSLGREVEVLSTEYRTGSSSRSSRPVEVLDVKYRRHGGPVEAGSPYVVGEVGPELIIPKQDGYVLTAAQTRALMGGGGGVSIPASGGSDRALLREIQGLRSDLKSVNFPQQQNNFTLVNEPDPYNRLIQLTSGLMRDRLRAGGF